MTITIIRPALVFTRTPSGYTLTQTSEAVLPGDPP